MFGHCADLCVVDCVGRCVGGVQVVSGSSLPVPSSGKLDPFVRVEILGINSDNCKRNTDTIKHNCKCCHTHTHTLHGRTKLYVLSHTHTTHS